MASQESLSWGAEATTPTADKQYCHSFIATLPAQRLKINENILFNWHEKDRLLIGLYCCSGTSLLEKKRSFTEVSLKTFEWRMLCLNSAVHLP
jgi:hypothetical protein